jgi:hypothetical protein
MGTPPPAPHFAPHGQAVVRWDDGVLQVEVSGPFNLEGVHLLTRTMLEGYRGLPAGTPVVNVCEMRGTLVYTPEAWEALRATIRATGTSGMRVLATAWIVGADVEGAGLLLPRARALFADAGRCFEVFGERQTAETWARRRLEDAQG